LRVVDGKGEKGLLPKQERLSLAREIKRVAGARQYSGKSPLLYLVARDNALMVSRLAVVVPKSLGNAVKRNRLRRRISSVFAVLKAKIIVPVDIVAYPRMVAVGRSSGEIFAAFMAILRSCHIVGCDV